MKIEDRIREYEKDYGRNWQRLIFLLRKHLDIWSHKHIKTYWGQMKLSYMPVICNITVDGGSTAMDIARKSMIVKQTMSRTLKELEEKGMIVSKTNKNDKRSEYLELSDSGKQLILEANIESAKLLDTYKELVGEKNLDITIEVINKIIAYHESLNIAEDEHFGD
jgi:DNA-binding MarR family transcriptional regulator